MWIRSVSTCAAFRRDARSPQSAFAAVDLGEVAVHAVEEHVETGQEAGEVAASAAELIPS
jgi:hypothetical protein